MPNNRTKGAFRGERADVELIEDAVFERRSFKAGVRPRKRRRIDYFRRTVNTLGLKTGCWIRTLGSAIESIIISRSGRRLLDDGVMIPELISLHRQIFGLRRW